MKKFLIVSSAFLLVLILIGVFVASYLGLVPGLSKYFVKQRDLGVTPNPQLVVDMRDEFKMTNTVTNASINNFVYSGETELNRGFTQEEVTSVLASWEGQLVDSPYKNAQVRINPDGTIEFSALVNVEKLAQLASDLGYSESEIEQGKKYAKLFAGDVPVYSKFTASAENNLVSFGSSNLVVGNLTVPSFLEEQIRPAVENMIQNRMADITNLQVRSAKVVDGEFFIDATIPKSISSK